MPTDILQLMKPRILLLLVITCAAGYVVATRGNPDLFQPFSFVITLLGLALVAGGANTVNMWYDQDIDKIMQRTQSRPLPAGRMSGQTVLTLGILWQLLGTTMLALLVNVWTAAAALAGGLFYVFIYTMLLKRRTVQNIVIGGAAGAFPPVVGWAAVQNDILHPLPWLLFTVIFLWTPPHFWALALLANKDYTNAGIPMLPVKQGVAATKIQIVFYLLLLIPFTLALGLYPPLGIFYTLAAAGLGVWWGLLAYRMCAQGTPEEVNIPLTKRMFKVSIYYLGLLFLAMVIDVWI